MCLNLTSLEKTWESPLINHWERLVMGKEGQEIEVGVVMGAAIMKISSTSLVKKTL